MNSAHPLRIGILGLDTSHPEAFTRLLNVPDAEWHVPGGSVVCGWPGSADDIPLSAGRVQSVTESLRNHFGVQILDSPEAVAESVDAILLTAMDARQHPHLLERVLPFHKPVFIDKPMALTAVEGTVMFQQAESARVPVFSCSALRFAPGWIDALNALQGERVLGADVFGPISYEPALPGFSWYGIHAIEMLCQCMGDGWQSLQLQSTPEHDVIVARWADGRIGCMRGNQIGSRAFGGVFHTSIGTRFASNQSQAKPLYASLLEAVIPFFQSGIPPVTPSQTLEILRFIDEANAQRAALVAHP